MALPLLRTLLDLAPFLQSLAIARPSDEARLKNQASCEARTRVKITNMKLDLQVISSEYGQHFDWEDTENHEIKMAMANVKPWEEKMMKLRKELRKELSLHMELMNLMPLCPGTIMNGYYYVQCPCTIMYIADPAAVSDISKPNKGLTAWPGTCCWWTPWTVDRYSLWVDTVARYLLCCSF